LEISAVVEEEKTVLLSVPSSVDTAMSGAIWGSGEVDMEAKLAAILRRRERWSGRACGRKDNGKEKERRVIR
jgi:hypothetical protein